jgi:inhibitor of KinA
MQITPLGDSALMLVMGDAISESTHREVQAAWRALAACTLAGGERSNAGLCERDYFL